VNRLERLADIALGVLLAAEIVALVVLGRFLYTLAVFLKDFIQKL